MNGSLSSAYLGKAALIGRVNSGKSTLFNRLCGTQAIVSPIAGATRDRIYGRCQFSEDQWCEVVDCGGYMGITEADFWQQSKRALFESKLAILLLDGSMGYQSQDGELGLWLKKTITPTLYVITKRDRSPQGAEAEFYNKMPYLTDPIAVSATTGVGLAILKQQLSHRLAMLSKKGSSHHRMDHEPPFQVTIVGKPNSGKSSLVNTLVSENRVCVSEEAGTTRDPVDVQVRFFNQSYQIFDTAGLRRPTKVSGSLEKQSTSMSIKLIRQSHLAMLVVDASCGFTDQDAKIVRLAQKAFRPIVVVVSKWDLVKNRDPHQQKNFLADLRSAHLASLRYVPIRFVSAVTKYGVADLYTQMEQMVRMYHKRISTSQVNQALQHIISRHTPHLVGGFYKRIRFYYISQVSTAPPTFVVKCNVTDALRPSYKVYFEKSLRAMLGFDHVPIRIFYRPKDPQHSFHRSTKQKNRL